MRRILVLLTSLSLLAGCNLPPAVAAPTDPSGREKISRYELRARLWGNLFYQIDCLAGQGHCSREAFLAQWKQWGWNAEDEARLARWQALKARYGKQVQLAEAAAMPLPPRFDGIRLWDKVRAASLNAESRQQLALNLSAVLRPADAEALMQLLSEFEPRFAAWWEGEGHALSSAGVRGMSERMRQPALAALLEQAGRFYRSSLGPQTVLGFNFIARPAGGERSLNGEQVENQSLIEVRRRDGVPDANLDVALHELCHYFYARSSPSDELALVQRFASANRPEAIAAYNLYNEVLATAFGNGLVARELMGEAAFKTYLAKAGSFYNDAFIDPLAKALYPRLEQALAKGETLSDAAFVSDYLALADKALGQQLRSPVPLLRTMAAAYEPELAPALQQLQTRLRAGSVWGANGLDAGARGVFERFNAISGVILVRNSALSQLNDWEPLLGSAVLKALRQGAGASNSLIYGIRRNGSSRIFVLVAPDAKGLETLVEKLTSASEIFEGALP